jgi:lactate dehydrogenase-like 2-hydroxyacid dehydrogenase
MSPWRTSPPGASGFDHINLLAARELGITVDNVGYAPDGVADFTVMSILMAISDARHRRGGDHAGLPTALAW